MAACLLIAGCMAGWAHGETPAAKTSEIPPAPTGHYMFRGYGASQSLSYVAIQQLLQDQQGFIWVGAENGLYRYDGYSFAAYGLTDGLPSAQIDSLHEDPSGVLWVGTPSGLSRWNGKSFDLITPAQGLATIPIADLKDGPGGLWVACAKGPHVGGSDGTFRLAQGWPGGEATAVWMGKKAPGMWVAQWNGEAQVWRMHEGTWRAVEGPAEQRKARIDALVEDGKGRLWARSAQKLWVLEPGSEHFLAASTPIDMASSYGYLTAGRHGDVWAPTETNILHLVGDTWSVLTTQEGLPPARIRAALEDRDGSLWVGSVGLHRLLGRGIFHAYTRAEGLPNILVWSFFRDHAQQLWVGTEQGLARLTPNGFETIAGTEKNAIRSIVEGPDGTLYMAGVPANEILVYDPERTTLRRRSIGTALLPKRIFRLLLDRDAILWASTDGAGLLRADTRDETLSFTPVALPDGDAQERVGDVRQDAAGRIWAAGAHGLALLEAGQWRRFTMKDGLRSDFTAYLWPTHGGDLLVGYFEPLGVARARYASGNFKIVEHFDQAAPRSTEKVFVVGEDTAGRIWIGGGTGLDMVGPDRNQQFRTADGLVGEDTANQAFLAEANGDVWIGTSAGIIRFDDKVYKSLPARAPPATTFLNLRLGQTSYSPGARDVSVTHQMGTFDARFSGMDYLAEGTMQYRLRLAGLESDFAITENRDARFPALSYGNYRFEVSARAGSYGEWGPTADFEFQVLPAWWQTWWFRILVALAAIGVIALMVRWRMAALWRHNRLLEDQVAARTSELSQANERQRDINVLLQTEIEDRRAAELALQHRNADLEALNTKLAGTQLQLLQSEKMASVGQLAAGVAHEINNPIGFVGSNLSGLNRYVDSIFSLLGDYEKLENVIPKDSAELHRVKARKVSIELNYLREDIPLLLSESLDGIVRIAKIVNDLKDFSHIGETEWQMADIHQCLESTLTVITHELKGKVEVVKEYAELPKIECLPFQLNQVFLNILINASQAVAGQGTITVRTGRELESVWVQISDTGCGISPTIIHRIFEPFFTTRAIGSGTGLGLSVAYGIVEEHSGTIEVHSEVGQGATFTIRLPIVSKKSSAPSGDRSLA